LQSIKNDDKNNGDSNHTNNNDINYSKTMRRTTPVTFALMSVESPYTKQHYKGKLKEFFDFVGLPGISLDEQGQAFLARAKVEKNNNSIKENNDYWAEDIIQSFLDNQRQRVEKGELAASTLQTFYAPIRAFCSVHQRDLPFIDWKGIQRTLPDSRTYSNDRAPTREEIQKVIKYPNRMLKPVVLAMCSSGIRLGAWNYLKWKHVIPKYSKDKRETIVAAKLVVYAGERQQYYTFITPEAYSALQEWKEYRENNGEKITDESWILINKKIGLATHPKKLSHAGVKKLLERTLKIQGLRKELAEGQRRYEWKTAHGYRKFFKTHAEQVMKPLNVELLMDHSTGLEGSYYKPTEQEVLDDYLKAVDLLTINDYNKSTLQKQMAELTEKSKEENYVIKGKLAEKDKEIQVAAREAEKAKQELAEMRIDMDQVKTKLANTTDQIATMLEILIKINRNEVILSDPEVKIFLEHKLGIMTNGRWGKHPDRAIVVEPVDY
jgi:hypothetical protein